MIFKYGTIETSLAVVDNYEIVNNHKLDIIRNANVNADQSLIYAEPLDVNLVEMVPENPVEERMLLSGLEASSFYEDTTRNRYLDLSETVVSFYIDGTNKKNQYLYNMPGINSNSVPFKLSDEYCMTGFTLYGLTAVSGDVITLRDGQGAILHTFTATGGTVTEDLTLDVLLSPNDISAYIEGIGLDAPALKVYLRKTYYPV